MDIHDHIEARMLRLCLAYDAAGGNRDTLDATLDSFTECPDCSANVILELVHTLNGVLDNMCYGDWRKAMQVRLAELLDEMAER